LPYIAADVPRAFTVAIGGDFLASLSELAELARKLGGNPPVFTSLPTCPQYIFMAAVSVTAMQPGCSISFLAFYQRPDPRLRLTASGEVSRRRERVNNEFSPGAAIPRGDKIL
jgi:hypothetical protein